MRGADELVELTTDAARAAELRAEAVDYPKVVLSDRELCDFELLACGGFSPLRTFMGKSDYESVLGGMRLASGALWPIPVMLSPPDALRIAEGKPIALYDQRDGLLAVLDVREVFAYDRDREARAVLGTNDVSHPGVAALASQGRTYVSGPLEVVAQPRHFDFPHLRSNPRQTRAAIAERNWRSVVALQTRNPPHRAHEELIARARRATGGGVLLHPAVGLTKPGDIGHYTRTRCYEALARNHYQPSEVLLALLPLAMRMAGPREALWHAIIRGNYGATHFIVGRDHAGPGCDARGEPFYDPYAAQRLVAAHEDEIGVKMVPSEHLVYVPRTQRYMPVSEVAPGEPTADISGTQVRDDYLAVGRPLPAWFMRPEIAGILSEANPPRHRQGVTIWLTGLSGAGKSTITGALEQRLPAHGRNVTVLDGDEIRTHLSKGLGFSKEDRDTNIRRVAYVASRIVAHGGTVICSVISPYRATRDEARRMIGNFVEVFVAAPLATCEQRDVKGLYRKARAGEIKGFTGIDDPYEAPERPEVIVPTERQTLEESVESILEALYALGYLRREP